MNPKLQYLKINRIFCLSVLTILSAVSSQAADKFWVGGTDEFTNAAAWSPVGVPNNDNAIITNGGTVLINSGDPTWVTFDIRAGQNGGDGAYIQNGGTVSLNSWFRLGVDPGTTGSYTLNGGTLNANPAFHVGEHGTGIMNINGGTISHTGGDAIIIGDRGGSATTLGTINQSGGVLTSSSEVWVGQGGPNGGSQAGTYNMSGSGVLNVNNWLAIGRQNANGVLNMTNGIINKNGGGNIVLGGLAGNGTVNQYGGTINNTNTGTWLGESVNGQGTWNLSGGTANLGVILLSLANTGSGSGTFNLSGTGLLVATEIRTNGIGASTFTFNGGTLQPSGNNTAFMHGLSTASIMAGGATINSASFAITISQTLTDGGGGGLTKIGNGILTLSGPNSYTGPTIIQAGKLIAGTASLVTSDVIVSNTAGYGVNIGVVNGQVNPGNVTLAGPANTLDFVLGGFGNPTFAPLNVTTALNVNGTVTVNISDAFPQVGQFPLVKYASKTGAGSFVLGTLPVGVSATLVNNTGNNSIDLNISSTALIRWDGLVAGGNWDINTTTNWTDYATTLSAKYTEGAAVYFDDLALGTTTVNLGVTVNPGSVILTNSILPYTLIGSGKINGATSLTKQGSNTFTIANSVGNTYTGPTVISGGTLDITNIANGGLPSAIGSSTANPANLDFDGGTLSYSGPATTTDRGYSVTGSSVLNLLGDLTVNGVLNPSLNANFVKSGPATLSYKRAGANVLSLGGAGTGFAAYGIASGTVVLDGSNGGQTNTVGGEVWVGDGTNYNSGGALILTNTTLKVSSWIAIARGTGNGGYLSTVSVYNSTLQCNNFSMGFDGGVTNNSQTLSIVTLNGGSTFTNTGDSNIGESGGSLATINLNDSSIYSGGNRTMVGWNGGTGVVTIANSATLVVNAWMSIGNQGGVGSVLVKDNGSLILPGGSSDLNICDVGTGQGSLTIMNNGSVSANNLFVGKGAGSVGTFTQSGGTTTGKNGGGTYIEVASSASASGTVNLNAGILKARQIQSVNGTANSTFNFNGGLLVAAVDAAQGVNNNFMNNLTAANIMTGGANIDSGTNYITIAQALLSGPGGDGGLTKIGNGTLLLNGVNTYTNTTLVTAGTFGGNGTIAGPVIIQSGATLSPGAGGIGTLTINNNLTMAGNVAVDVNKTNLPASDLVTVSGTLSKTGTGTMNVSNLGPALQVGDAFTLFSQPVVNGNALTVVGGGVVWTNMLAINGSIQVVSLALPPTFSPGGVSHLANGNISLTATGTVGSSYTLWASTNLALRPITNTWTLLNSGTVTVSPFTIIDTTATNYAHQFYIFSTP